MLRMLVGGLVAVVAVVAIVLIWAHWRWNSQIEADIRSLKAGAGGPGVLVTGEMLASLPAPVRRYLTHSGVIGRPIPGLVRLTQRGRIRGSAEASWMNLEAVEYYSTRPPAFVWKASFPGHNLPIVFGRDAYFDGNGSMLIKMLSLYPIADEQGEAVRDAALMRYLNEMMWFPAAFLGDNVTWRAIDDASAEVSLADRGRTVTGTMFFDAEGRVVNFRAVRFNTTTRTMETWETPIWDYGEYDGLRLPSKGAAVWKLPGGDFGYIELEIMKIANDPGD